MELRKFLAPEIVTGNGSIALAGRFAGNLGGGKVMLITDPGLQKAGWVKKVEDSLRLENIPYIIYDNVTPNPKDHEVMLGAELFLKENCKAIVALGGGSPMDCAKGVAIVSTNGRNILSFEGVDKVDIPMPPLICIPTTAGTAADISQFAIISDTTRMVKIAIISKAIVPDVALIDPETNLTKPNDLTAATGMDALVHAIEAFVSNASSDITNLHAMEAIRLISTNLLEAIKNPKKIIHREKMMLASLFAGLAFSNASLGLVHGMAHSMGGQLDSAHGDCNSILLEHVVDFNFDAEPDKFKSIAEIWGIYTKNLKNDEIKKQLVEKISIFRKSVGITFSLTEMGVKKEHIRQLAINAKNDPCLLTNPKQPTIEEIEKLYEAAL